MRWPLDQIDRNGFAIVDSLLTTNEVADAAQAIDSLESSSSVRRRGGATFARRNLLEAPFIQNLAHSRAVRSIVEAVLGETARPVRGILFDKTPTANWIVPWHQDLSIAVAHRHDTAGFGPWSIKAGVAHVQPPVEVLRQMVTVRIHLDDCSESNGPLKVIARSHHHKLSPAEVESAVASGNAITCVVKAGGAVVIRPMILHASYPATQPNHRRVIHLEYAGCGLPPPLEWAFDRENQSAVRV